MKKILAAILAMILVIGMAGSAWTEETDSTDTEFQSKVDALVRPTQISDFTMFLYRYQFVGRLLEGREVLYEPEVKIVPLKGLAVVCLDDDRSWSVIAEPWSGAVDSAAYYFAGDPEAHKIEVMSFFYSLLRSEEKDHDVYAAWCEKNMDEDYQKLLEGFTSKSDVPWGNSYITLDKDEKGMYYFFLFNLC